MDGRHVDDDADGYGLLECFRYGTQMPTPDEGERIAASWALEADGDVVYRPIHIPGPPYGWRDKVTILTREQIRGSVDPAKVPEQFRHLFE
ncbi:hypothetical protein [Arthrobacter sp. MDT1-65]